MYTYTQCAQKMTHTQACVLLAQNQITSLAGWIEFAVLYHCGTALPTLHGRLH
jgi:hypothetical protein